MWMKEFEEYRKEQEAKSGLNISRNFKMPIKNVPPPPPPKGEPTEAYEN